MKNCHHAQGRPDGRHGPGPGHAVRAGAGQGPRQPRPWPRRAWRLRRPRPPRAGRPLGRQPSRSAAVGAGAFTALRLRQGGHRAGAGISPLRAPHARPGLPLGPRRRRPLPAGLDRASGIIGDILHRRAATAGTGCAPRGASSLPRWPAGGPVQSFPPPEPAACSRAPTSRASTPNSRRPSPARTAARKTTSS